MPHLAKYGHDVDLPRRGRVFVYDLGGHDKPTIVLIHGSPGGSLCSWSAVLEDLSRSYRVIAMDCRGHGRTPLSTPHHREAPFTVERCADDVSALLSHLKIQKAVICGYSMGGAVALSMAHRHPQQTAGLVLCSTALTFVKVRFQRLLHMTAAGTLASIVEAVPTALSRAHARGTRSFRLMELARTSPRAAAQAEVALESFNAHPWIAQLNMPAHIIITSRDSIVPAADQFRMARDISRARVTVNPSHRGHLLIPSGGSTIRTQLLDACADLTRRSGLATPPQPHSPRPQTIS